MPAGTPHTFGNAGPSAARFRAEDRPALQSEGFFETYFGLAQDGKLNPRTGLPPLLHLAVVLHHYRDEIVLARPPRLVQRVLFGLLAPIGRLRGYRVPYPCRDGATDVSLASGA